jgi:hypothetical protein
MAKLFPDENNYAESSENGNYIEEESVGLKSELLNTIKVP